MTQVVVDTNVLVSFLTDRDAAQQEQSAHLFKAGADGEAALILPQAVVTELVYVLCNLYGLGAPEAAATIRDLLELPGLAVVDEISWPLLLDLWPGEIPSLGDAIIVAIALRGRYEAIATFDRDLIRAFKRRGLRSYW